MPDVAGPNRPRNPNALSRYCSCCGALMVPLYRVVGGEVVEIKRSARGFAGSIQRLLARLRRRRGAVSADDGLDAARGCALACVLSVPFWAALGWLLW